MRDLKAFQHDLINWFTHNKRDLPWRQTRDPYKILLSEVLLQQTQVSRGIEYYVRFVTAFPTVQDLANASVDAVLKAWEGAGYYARARNLHRAAQQIAQFGFPKDVMDLQKLPGVGAYTAGAVASIAFGQAVPVVDGNVRRVLARLLYEINPTTAWLWLEAARLLKLEQPGDWNQALMELGALVCTPKNPSCGMCPVVNHCAAFALGCVSGTPAPKARVVVKVIRAVALVLGRAGRYVLVRRPKQGLLGGLYGFPLLEVTDVVSEDAALAVLLERYGFLMGSEFVGCVSHTMTHRQFEIRVYALGQFDGLLEGSDVVLEGSDVVLQRSDVVLQRSDGVLQYPYDVALSRLDQKILAVLESK